MDTNITEKVERYNEVGQVVRVTLRWRGKIYYLQMFFPGSKFPSRGEVETQVKKIYPDAVVMIHYASETQPNQPLIRVNEEAPKLRYGNYGNYVSGQTREPTKKEYINPNKLPVANASYEPQGETMNEQQMSDKPNVPGSGVNKTTGSNIGNKIKSALKNAGKNLNQQIKNIDDNPVKGYSKILQMNGQEPEGEVIKEEEKENPTFVQFMKRIDQLPEVTREAIKNCGNDPAIAKAALEISGIDK